MKRSTGWVLGLLFAGSLAVIFLMAHRLGTVSELAAGGETVPAGENPAAEEGAVSHNPPSMDDVPEGPLGDAILRGHELVNNTSEALRDEASSTAEGEAMVNELSCASCHAGAGTDEKALSLVGVSTVYPQYNSRADKVLTLEQRINGCMVRSMNGQELDEKGEDMAAMIAYMNYISEDVPVGADLAWRKGNEMKDIPEPNVADGEALYQQSCIACHAADGAGTGPNSGPALWGEGSFNDGAGMARMSKITSFIQKNMPLGQGGTLTDQEAADLAAFILSKDRPEWKGHDKDWPKGGRPSDTMNKQRRDEIKEGTIDWDQVLGKE